MARTIREPDERLPIACITDTLGTQHQRRGVLLLALEQEDAGIFVRREDIPALLEDLQFFLDNAGMPTRLPQVA